MNGMENMSEEEKKKLQETANQATAAVADATLQGQTPQPIDNSQQPQPEAQQPVEQVIAATPGQPEVVVDDSAQPMQAASDSTQETQGPDNAMTTNAMGEETPVNSAAEPADPAQADSASMGSEGNIDTGNSMNETVQDTQTTDTQPTESGPTDYINQADNNVETPQADTNDDSNNGTNMDGAMNTPEQPVQASADEVQDSASGPSLYEKIANGDGRDKEAIITGQSTETPVEGPGFSSMTNESGSTDTAPGQEQSDMQFVPQPTMPGEENAVATETNTGVMPAATADTTSDTSSSVMQTNETTPSEGQGGSSLESVIGSGTAPTPSVESTGNTMNMSDTTGNEATPMGSTPGMSTESQMNTGTVTATESTPQPLSPAGGNVNVENTMPGSNPSGNASELPTLPNAEANPVMSQTVENPVEQSTSGAAAQTGMGASSGKPAVQSLTPQDNVNQVTKKEEGKKGSSDDSSMMTVLLIVGLAVVMGALIIILVFTFVVTPQEGTFFFSLRETFSSIF